MRPVLEKLTYFVAVAREQSFRRAAEACGVAQPTLSAGIKQLEDECGAMLVLRSSRFHGLTPEGEKVLVWAKRLIGDARAMRQELQSMKAGLTGHLRIAVIPTALAMVPVLTTPCRRRHPALQFTVLSCPSSRILEMLENLEVDAGITYLNNEPLGRLQAVPLYTERYRFITTEGALFADRPSVTWAELSQVPLCLLTPDMQNRRIMDRLMRDAGVEPRAALESNSQVTLLGARAGGRLGDGAAGTHCRDAGAGPQAAVHPGGSRHGLDLRRRAGAAAPRSDAGPGSSADGGSAIAPLKSVLIGFRYRNTETGS